MDIGDSDVAIKVVVVGDSGVGKSCLLKQFSKQAFDDMYVSTIGVDFETKKIDVKGKSLKLYLWDTAGQERFRNITRSYYRGAHAVVLVYDVTDASSYNNARRWMHDVRELCTSDIVSALAANKSDMENEKVISFEKGKKLAEELGTDCFFETSAKTGLNVEYLFYALSEAYLKVAARRPPPVVPDRVFIEEKEPSSKCC